MGKFILHVGPAGPYYFFRDKIYDHLHNHHNSFLYLLPVNRAVRYLKKIVVSDLTPRALLEPNIYTFDELFRFLYQKIPGRKIIAGGLIRLSFLNYLFRNIRGDLDYFQSGHERMIIKIDQMLAEILEFGIHEIDDLEPPETCRVKFKDFRIIIGALFDQYGANLIDEYAVPASVLQNLNDDIVRKYLGSDLRIYVSGYGIYTPPMVRMLERLKTWADIELKLDYMPDNPQLFEHTRNAYEMLRRIADREQEYEKGDPQGIKLFSHRIPENPAKSDSQKYHRLIGKNPHDEVMQIAAHIRRWYRERIPLHQIGITFPNLEAYAPLIRRIFRKFKIPYNLSTGFSLAQSPLVLAYVQVIEIVLSRYDCNAFQRVLISPFCRFRSGADAHLFNRLTTKLHVQYLTGNWQQKLATIAAGTGMKAEFNAEDLSSLMASINDILAILRRLEQPLPIGELCATYLAVLQDLGMIQWYERDDSRLEREMREKEFRAFNRFMKIVEQLKWTLSYIYRDEPVDLRKFYAYLKPLLQESTYNLKEWSEYGVQIMPRLEILSLNCRRLIVGGLIEGDFPRRFTRDIFFSDLERAQLGLNAAEDLVAQDRFLFYQLMVSGAEEIILSHPSFDGDTAQLPSTFIESLAAIYPINLIQPADEENDLITADNFLEIISRKLNEQLSDRNLSDLLAWADLTGTEQVIFWLNGINDQLTKQLRDQFSRYEGNLRDSVLVQPILRNVYHDHIFSVSALESYAFCPMQYFLQRVLGLEEEEAPEEYISAREKGALIHSILFEFYQYLRKNKAADRPWAFRDRLIEIAVAKLEQLPYEGILWAVEKESLLGNETNYGLLDRFLEEEKSFLSVSGYTPRFFELAFGPAGKDQGCDPASRDQPLKLTRENRELQLTGKIDRIDTESGDLGIIIDYKLSGDTKGRRLPDMLTGQSLQLPIYTMAVTQILPGIRPVAAAYYQVKDARNCGRQFIFADGTADYQFDLGKKVMLAGPAKLNRDDIALQDLLDTAEGHLFRLTDDLRTGKFSHTINPDDDRCVRYCPFSRICRKDVGKLRHLASGETA